MIVFDDLIPDESEVEVHIAGRRYLGVFSHFVRRELGPLTKPKWYMVTYDHDEPETEMWHETSLIEDVVPC